MRRLSSLLVVAGTFSSPIAQWVVFLLVARIGGSGEAGSFALLLAVSTPLVIGTNWGLRNAYITLQESGPFSDFVVLRGVGVLAASALVISFGWIASLPMGMVLGVVLFKAADSMADIWYGRWQRQQRLLPFGAMMVLNGVATIAVAIVAAATGLSTSWIVASSAVGSIVTLVSIVTVDRHPAKRWLSKVHAPRSAYLKRLTRIVRDSWMIGAAQVLAALVISVPIWAVAVTSSAHTVGRFAAAAYLVTVGALLGAAVNSVVIGGYRAALDSGGIDHVRRRARRGATLATTAGLLATGVIAMWGSAGLELVYGDQFTFERWELALVSLAAALMPATYLINAALLALNAYASQLTIQAMGLGAGVVVAVVGHLSGSPGFVVGSLCALSASLVKFGASHLSMERAVRRATLRRTSA